MKKDIIQLAIIVVIMNVLLSYAHADEQYKAPVIEVNFSEYWAEYGNVNSILNTQPKVLQSDNLIAPATVSEQREIMQTNTDPAADPKNSNWVKVEVSVETPTKTPSYRF